MNYSFWEKYFIAQDTDITIIGSGIVGLSTAISIKESAHHLSVKILERGSVAYGASTKNAGFSCFGSVSELLHDIDLMGESSCMEVVEMRWKGLKILRNRVGDEALEYKHVGGTELFRKNDVILQQKCFDNIIYCNELIEKYLGLTSCYSIKKNDGLDRFEGRSIYNQYEGTINPVSMMNALKKRCNDLNINIFYGVEVEDIDVTEKNIKTKHEVIIPYQKLIVCTNGFTKSLFPSLEVIPARNQVLITKPLKNLSLPSAYHLDEGYVYFRQYHDRILLGGGRNLDIQGETTVDFGNTPAIQTYLSAILDEIYPGASAQIDYWWSGILGIGPSKYPLIQWMDEDVLVGVRLGGMGVAIGSHLGEVLALKVVTSFDKER